MSTKADYIWATADKVGGIVLAFLFNLVMARWFLSPREFGLIGMLQIFISLGYTTSIAGFGQTIVQAGALESKDINTIFTTNLLISIAVYSILFFIAPAVATFYQEPILLQLLRILGLQLLICSFFIVQYNLALRRLQLRKLCLVSISSSVIGYSLGIILATNGFGVWSLVVATLSIYLLQNVGLWLTSKDYPRPQISRSSFRKLIPFSSFIYFATIVEQAYMHGLALILGKQFAASTVGYYTQANKLQQVPSSAIQDIGYQVLFSKLSRQYATGEPFIEEYRRNSRLITALSVLAFSTLFLVAKPAVLILFSDKWAESIPMLRILTPVGLFLILSFIPTILIRAIGDAKGYFLLSTIEKLGGIVLLIILSFLGLYPTLWGLVAINFLCYLCNIYYVSRVTDITFKSQIIDSIVLLLPQAIAVLAVNRLLIYIAVDNIWIEFVVGVILPIITFVFILRISGYLDPKMLFNLLLRRS